MQECYDDATDAFRRSIELKWLDSAQMMHTGLVREEHKRVRSMTYQEFLCAYVNARWQQGFELLSLHACAPLSCEVCSASARLQCPCVGLQPFSV